MGRPERDCLIVLAHARFLRAPERIALAGMLGGTERLERLGTGELAALLGRTVRTGSWDPSALLAAAERTVRLVARGRIGCTCWGDTAYPAALAEIHDPPAVVFHRGAPPDAGRPLVGVVGTRLPTGAGRDAAFRLGFELAREAIGVVSGLARGIDREAHEGCSRTGGYSIGVLGCGPDLVVPAASRGAARRLLEAGGMLLSEYPPGTVPRPWHFPERNRIISGLCRSVVVVEAPEGSGALYTADFALEQGRDLYVHAAGLAGSTGAGTRQLAAAGATVIRSASGILADWGRCSGPPWGRCSGPPWGRCSGPPRGRQARAGESTRLATDAVRARTLQHAPAGPPRKTTAATGAAIARLARDELDGSGDARLDGTYGGS
jgi:DNA processing protein